MLAIALVALLLPWGCKLLSDREIRGRILRDAPALQLGRQLDLQWNMGTCVFARYEASNGASLAAITPVPDAGGKHGDELFERWFSAVSLADFIHSKPLANFPDLQDRVGGTLTYARNCLRHPDEINAFADMKNVVVYLSNRGSSILLAPEPARSEVYYLAGGD